MVPACIILFTATLCGIVKRLEYLRRKALCKHEVLFTSCLLVLIICNLKNQVSWSNGLVLSLLGTCVLGQWLSILSNIVYYLSHKTLNFRTLLMYYLITFSNFFNLLFRARTIRSLVTQYQGIGFIWIRFCLNQVIIYPYIGNNTFSYVLLVSLEEKH